MSGLASVFMTSRANVTHRDSCSAAWVRLQRDGWTAKKAFGCGAGTLETRWLYIAPSSSARGIEGQDYAIGEDNVVAYVKAL